MSTVVSTPEAISENDPRLHTIQPDPAPWSPPIPWDHLTIDRDARAWVEELVRHGLVPKANGAVTCGKFFRKILEYSDHWVRAGCSTCHLMSCRNCGRGKMRAHRIYTKNPVGYMFMVAQDSRTIRLVVSHATPCDDKRSYRQRVESDKRYVAAFRRRVRRDFGGGPTGPGFLLSVELDVARRDSIYRLYYVGPRISHGWIQEQWQQIVGVQAECTSKFRFQDKSPDALRDTLDSLTPILMLPGPERAAWEEAFQGFRFTATIGSLRGVKPERAVDDDYKTGDPAAPYGLCPCGCNGVVQKSSFHSPLTLTQLSQQFKEVDFGPLKYYSARRSKANADMPRMMENWMDLHPNEPFPPFQGRYGPS
jgi:hypothetical protein